MLLKTNLAIVLIIILSSLIIPQKQYLDYLQQKGEVYFTFEIKSVEEVNQLTNIISVDNVVGSKVYAYANEKEFEEFLKLNYQYEILTHPGDLIQPVMGQTIEDVQTWDVYPTYDVYVALMNQFAANYPSICKIVDIGNTVQGRKILYAKISSNVNIREAKPQFMYTSSMHGDELTGYVLMLRLIDSLLTGYGNNQRITNLVNNIEIWINPLANPDGTYRSGNNTVYGATRGNSNGFDLNRNFPDPINGVNPNQQIETTRFRTLEEANNFSLIANFHGGEEVVNYPWDRWINVGYNSRVHADQSWYEFISRQYADTCHKYSSSGYMTGLNNGVTNGGAWYVITGGRQDYTNWYRWGREVTIEISATKTPLASLLPNFWEYNKRSFLNYMENVLYGVRGLVTDMLGSPLKVLVTVVGHDVDNSQIYSDSSTGFYLRMLAPGTYSFTFSAPGFNSKTTNNVTVSNFSTTYLNVQLTPTNAYQIQLTALLESLYDGSTMIPDTVTVELHNSAEPFSLVDQKKVLLNSAGYGTAYITSIMEIASYYVIVKHRGSIETWGSAPVSFINGILTYDFTNAQRKTFGYNSTLKGTKWCIFSGDVNQDAIIDLADLALIDNDKFNSISGYVSTDLNGNNIVDNDDLLICYNNAFKGIKSITPLQTQKEINYR